MAMGREEEVDELLALVDRFLSSSFSTPSKLDKERNVPRITGRTPGWMEATTERYIESGQEEAGVKRRGPRSYLKSRGRPR